jgi:Ca2+-binding RTX toxin-like protein
MPSGRRAAADHLGMRVRSRFSAALALAAIATGGTALGVAAGPAIARADDASQTDRCADRDTKGTNCQEGNGRKTAGGGKKVSHKGWPAVTGILWIAQTAGDRTYDGTDDNDELNSHHSSDTLNGGLGNDILWGDWDPSGNTTKQHDNLNGGEGDDWLYASHGYNTMKGGPGKDFLYAYYGHGVIDCGEGKHDTAKIRLGTGQYKVRNCERILNFCAYGSIGGKRCAKPGEKARRNTV